MDPPYLRTNPPQEGGEKDLGLTRGPIKGQITRSMLKRIQEDIEHEDSNGLMGFKCFSLRPKRTSRFDGLSNGLVV